MNYIYKAGSILEPGILIGGKARALNSLHSSGLPVPAWCVVTPDAFLSSITKDQQEQISRAEDPGVIQAILQDIRIPPDVANEVNSAVSEICRDGEYVAVRSSAIDEDGKEHSFAGQLESYLFVSPDEVLGKVIQVWRSGFSERILAYRRENKLRFIPTAPGVLIQRMVNADVSGVAFAADPVSGRRSIAVVGALYGAGTAIVSGDCDADTFHVDLHGNIVFRNIADKKCCHRQFRGEDEGVRKIEVQEELRKKPSLEDKQILAVAELVRNVSEHFGNPQDIEWAFSNGELYLLQSRPITTLKNIADPDGVMTIWDNSNIAESYAGITTPMTFSFAKAAYAAVYHKFLLIMKVPREAVDANQITTGGMIGLIRGRIYYNLINWYRALALMPGFRMNRKFMEQMMGVTEELPQDIIDKLASAQWREKFTDSFNFIGMVLGLIGNYLKLNRNIRIFQERFERSLEPPSKPIKEMRLDELCAYYKDLKSNLFVKWDAPMVNDFFAMIFYGLLGKVVASWCGTLSPNIHNDLLCDQGGIISTEPANRVKKLAKLASKNQHFTDLLCDGSLPDIQSELEKHADFKKQYDEYLAKFGDRCLGELKLESRTLYDDPMILLRSIGHLAQRISSGANVDEESGRSISRESETKIKQALGVNLIKRWTFNWILRNARERIRNRENLRFERTRIYGLVRQIIIEMGKRLYSMDLIDNVRDVFYLEIDELLGFDDGTATTVDIRELIRVRKEEYERYRKLPAPSNRFVTYGPVNQGNKFIALAHSMESPSGDTLKGIGCCPGVVKGQVRIVRDPSNVNLTGSQILVAERTDPGWVMLFPSASALLVERGNLLSHAAIVSREMGIPSIVALNGVTSWLKDGDWVEMDGGSGIVRKLNPDEVTFEKRS